VTSLEVEMKGALSFNLCSVIFHDVWGAVPQNLCTHFVKHCPLGNRGEYSP
jgi:hypothetical protein